MPFIPAAASSGVLRLKIKPGRRMVIVADSSLDALLAKAGFDIITKHKDRVHGILTRHIFICQKASAKVMDFKNG